jgi:hypothetical protein
VGWSNGAQTAPRTLLRVPSSPSAFALDASRFAWVGGRVVVADLDTSKRVTVAHRGTENETSAAVAGSTVLWLQSTGGTSVIDTLRAAAPGRQKRFGRWGDDDYYLESGPRFGGVAADRTALVYSVYELTSDERKTGDCYNKGICHWHVTGGSTFLVRPSSLSRHRILPPATAVAVDGNTVAAATVKLGERYTNKAQIVLSNLSGGSPRPVGEPADVAQLVLHGDRLAAVTVDSTGAPSVRIWNVKTRELVRTVRLPSSAKLEYFAWTRGKLLLQGRSRGRGAILALDLRTGRRKVVARIEANFVYGPWAWRGGAVWVEQERHTLVKFAPL